MSTAELVVPLTKPAAKSLDKKIRLASDRAAAQLRLLLGLLGEAVAGQAHVALGSPSAAVWLHDAVRIAPDDPAARKMLSALVNDKRLTPRQLTAMFAPATE